MPPTFEDMQRAEELGFSLFSIPAAFFSGVKSAFTQAFPLTSSAYTTMFDFSSAYGFLCILVFFMLSGDAILKAIRLYRLTLTHNFRPWKSVARVMGVRDGQGFLRIPLSAYIVQITLMIWIDFCVSFFLALTFGLWIPFLALGILLTRRRPKSYYEFDVLNEVDSEYPESSEDTDRADGDRASSERRDDAEADSLEDK